LTQVQYTLSQLDTSHPGRGGNDVTRAKVIQALSELAEKHEKYRREIMARSKYFYFYFRDALSTVFRGAGNYSPTRQMRVEFRIGE
jgi:hypothetical protein